MHSSTETGRIAPLDGVRGVAILLVMAFHFSSASVARLDNLTGFDDALLEVTRAGWIGVNLFFVLSGFLITNVLLESKNVIKPYFRNFYARRALRIFPVYIVFILCIMCVLPSMVRSAEREATIIRDSQCWLWSYLLNSKFYIDPSLIFTRHIGHLWSLAVEEQFYLVWPAFVFLLSRKTLIVTTVAAIVIAFVLRATLVASGESTFLLYYLTPLRMDDLAIGALVAMIVRSPAARPLVRGTAWWIAGAMLAGVVVLFALRDSTFPFDTWVFVFGFSMLGVLFGAIVAAVAIAPPGSRASSILSHSLLTFFGKYSYAMYVIHLPVALFLALNTSLAQSIFRLSGSAIPAILVFTATATAISVLIAMLSWYLLELPFLRLRKRFASGSVSIRPAMSRS